MSDIAWASGLIDGEGWIGWTKGRHQSLSPTVKVVNTEYELLEVLLTTFGVGSIRARTKYLNQKQAWVWSVYGANAWAVLECTQPYLQSPAKQAQVQLMVEHLC